MHSLQQINYMSTTMHRYNPIERRPQHSLHIYTYILHGNSTVKTTMSMLSPSLSLIHFCIIFLQWLDVGILFYKNHYHYIYLFHIGISSFFFFKPRFLSQFIFCLFLFIKLFTLTSKPYSHAFFNYHNSMFTNYVP